MAMDEVNIDAHMKNNPLNQPPQPSLDVNPKPIPLLCRFPSTSSPTNTVMRFIVWGKNVLTWNIVKNGS